MKPIIFKKPLLVSMWAPPGVGKSSTAAMVFNILKHRGYRTELVLEFAKDITYERNWKAFDDNFFIVANQERRASRLVGEVDIIITDSPPGLGLLYCPEHDKDVLRDMVMHFRHRYEHSDWLLQRDTSRAYQTYGRTQTLEQSTALEETLRREIKRIAPNHRTAYADAACSYYIADHIDLRMRTNGQ